MHQSELLGQAALFSLACLLYANTLSASFTFDDNFAVINNSDVVSDAQPLSQLLRNDFWGQALSSDQSHKSYRPLTVLAFRLERYLGDRYLAWRPKPKLASGHDNSGSLDPLPFHATNVALHAIVTLLVYRVAKWLAGRRGARWQAGVCWEAFWAAALFTTHPVHTEAVAGVVGQAELLCAALALSAFLTYTQAASDRLTFWRQSTWLGITAALVWAASLAKEIGITIVAAMILCDLLLSGGGEERRPGAETPGRPPQRLRSLLRWCVLAAVAAAYVRLRSWLAVNHLVSIYRKVENPIPFASSAVTRATSIAYLHSRYAALLIAPLELSADWSHACIPLVESLNDPRNLWALGLYSGLAWVLIKSRPAAAAARILNGRSCLQSPHSRLAAWRAVVVFGLLVAPFFPASNVLFYVGTFVGERLLYFPSVGFCLLAGQGIASLLCTDNHSRNAKASLFSARRAILPAVLALLAGFSLKTVTRNEDWRDEEKLFRAAQKVCWGSAKVQLNSGILERRLKNWDRALEHFEAARGIEPGYCEPGYWIGVTLVETNKDVEAGLKELEGSLQCKFVTAEAAKALSQIYQQLIKGNPGAPESAVRWAAILRRPPLERVDESCDLLEETALATANLDIVEPCLVSSEGNQSDPTRQLAVCVRARKEMAQLILAPGGATSVPTKLAVYKYISRHGDDCRTRPGPPAGQAGASAGHVGLVHRAQKADAEDAWLQEEWGRVLAALGRGAEASRHFYAAGMLHRRSIMPDEEGEPLARLGIHPVTGAVKQLSKPAVAAASLLALQAFQQSAGVAYCKGLKVTCEAQHILLRQLEAGDREPSLQRMYRLAEVRLKAEECMEAYVTKQECHQ